MNSRFALAWRNLRRNPRRTQIALVAIAFGVAAFAVAGGFIEWILVNFREHTIHSFLGHVQISRPANGEVPKSPFAMLLPDQPGLDAEIRRIAHVVAIAPRLDFQGLISNGESSLSFLGTGVDPDREIELSRNLNIIEGSGLVAADEKGAILGEGLAQSLGARLGDRLVLLANTAHGGVNAVEITVRGLFTSVTKAYDDSALRVPVALARQLLRVQGAHATSPKTGRTSFGRATAVVLRRFTMAIVALATVGALALSGAMLWAIHDMPLERPSDASRPALLLEAADGDALGRVGPLKFADAAREDFPDRLVQAVLSIEDRRFYSHFGIDPVGIVRAARRNAEAGEIVEGGSTITQQLVKMRILGNDRTFARKLREALTAIWLDRRLGKEEILTRYLNNVYLGGGAHGMPAARDSVFGHEDCRSCARISVHEAVDIAAVPSVLLRSKNGADFIGGRGK